MTPEEQIDVGHRIRDFLRSHDYNQADAAREFSKRSGISFGAAQTKIHRIIKGKFESNMDFLAYLYERFEANIGFLITGLGSPHVKPLK